MGAGVTVNLFAAARAAAGSSQVRVDPGSLTEIHSALLAAHAALAEVLPRCSFLVNGLAVHGDVTLTDGDELDVLPPFAGG